MNRHSILISFVGIGVPFAFPIFEMEAAGTERGDEGLAALEEAEARIRKEWVPS